MASATDEVAHPAKRQRTSSRWEPIDRKAVEQTRLLSRLQTITQAINTNTLPVESICRSPSPPPVYDNRGKRVNTKYDRALDKVEVQRFKLVNRLKQLDSTFIPPRGMRPPKVVDKLYLPRGSSNPAVPGKQNAIGLILGPRGNTQKRLEKDHQCKVAIRGKGSIKDGRARGPAHMEDQEPLHVVITAEGLDAKDRIEECKKKILFIITPRQDEDNDHKQAQLRELAQLNGTFRDPDRHGKTDDARPASRGPATSTDAEKPANDNELDEAYRSLIKDVSGSGPGSSSGSAAASASAEQLPVTPDKRGPPPPGTYAQTLLAKAPWLQPGAYATRPPSPPPPGTLPPPPPPPQHQHHRHAPPPPHAFMGMHPPPPPHHVFPPPPPGPPPHHLPFQVNPYMDAAPPQFGVPPPPQHIVDAPPPPPPPMGMDIDMEQPGSGVLPMLPPPPAPDSPTPPPPPDSPPPPPPPDSPPPPPPPDSPPPPPPPDSPPPPPPPA